MIPTPEHPTIATCPCGICQTIRVVQKTLQVMQSQIGVIGDVLIKNGLTTDAELNAAAEKLLNEMQEMIAETLLEMGVVPKVGQ